MTGTDLLWTVYQYLPEAFFVDFVVMQGALRFSYWRSKRRLRSSCTSA